MTKLVTFLATRWRRSPALQTALFVAFDVVIVWASVLLAYFLRFQGAVPTDFLVNVIPVAVAASLLFPAVFWLMRLYHHVWRYVGLEVLVKLAAAVTIGFLLSVLLDLLATRQDAPRFVPIGTLFIMCVFIYMGSGSLRAFGRLLVYMQSAAPGDSGQRVLIIGAGDAGSLLLRDIQNQQDLGIRVVGFLDDDPAKQKRDLRGVEVLGPVEMLPDVVESFQVDEVFVALPSLLQRERRRVLDICTQAGVKTRIVPSFVRESQHVGVSDLRRVSVTDLLGRDPVQIDLHQTRNSTEGKVVAVTGAAGSIGAELCRQIVRLGPKRLVMVDIDESRLYETYLDLLTIHRQAPRMHICDIRDQRKLDEVFAVERPELVLHAAAYKHVPLMELAPDEAVKTNVTGTRNVIEACERAGVNDFLLISTDKAVMPVSVMGVTKAIAERMTLDACRRGLRASAVRFGNVLGSRGSVVPLFEEQLRRGGPLLVTHPDITRYFMTIPEAALLVLQAQAITAGGEIFVLEMGEPVRIVDLARKMITLSGVDTSIEFTGLRPAEKMQETLVQEEAHLTPTGCEKIMRLNCVPLPQQNLDALVKTLGTFARVDDREALKILFARTIPEFIGTGEMHVAEEDIAQMSGLLGFDYEMETLF